LVSSLTPFNLAVTLSNTEQLPKSVGVHLPFTISTSYGNAPPLWGYVPFGWRLIYLTIRFLAPVDWIEYKKDLHLHKKELNRKDQTENVKDVGNSDDGDKMISGMLCDCSGNLSLSSSTPPSSSFPSSSCNLSPLLDMLIGQASALIQRWYFNHQTSLRCTLKKYSTQKDDLSEHVVVNNTDPVETEEKDMEICSLCTDACVEALRALSLFPVKIYHRIISKG
jgi:hypothetical protein